MAPVDMASLAEFLAKPDRLQTIRYELNVVDFTRTAFSHPLTKRRLRIGIGFGVLFLLFAVWLWYLEAPIGTAFFICAAIVFPLLIRFSLKRQVQKQVLSFQSILSEPMELSYGPGVVAYKSAVAFSYVQWLYQVVRTKEYRLLGVSNQGYFIVPVKAFANPMALAEFDGITSELAQGRVIGK